VIGRDERPFVIGGFLGLGAHLVAVPFKTKINEANRKIVLRVRPAPRLKPSTVQVFTLSLCAVDTMVMRNTKEF